jgi:hypothetical protein
MRIAFTIAALVCMAAPAHAGTANGKVAAFRVDATHVVLSVTGTTARRAPCNVNNGFAADALAPLGQAVGQTVDAVQKTEFSVNVTGSGTCTVLPGYEDIVSIRVSTSSSPK